MKLNIAHLVVTLLLCVLVTLVLIENRRSHQALMENEILQSELEMLKLAQPCEKPSGTPEGWRLPPAERVPGLVPIVGQQSF